MQTVITLTTVGMAFLLMDAFTSYSNESDMAVAVTTCETKGGVRKLRSFPMKQVQCRNGVIVTNYQSSRPVALKTWYGRNLTRQADRTA